MKSFAKKSSIFFLFFVLFFTLLNLSYLGILVLTDYDFIKRYESLRLSNPKYDLLVLGNSLPEYGFDTEFLTSKGINSYNLAIIGNSCRSSYVQLNEYLQQNSHRPKYVLHCIASWSESFENDGIHPIIEFSMDNHVYGISDIPIMKFRWFGVEILKKIISSKHRKTNVSHGQVKSPKVVPDHTDYKTHQIDIEKIEDSYWIGEIARLCNENEIEIIVIEMPGIKEEQNISDIGPNALNFKNGHSAILYNFNSQDFCMFMNSDLDWCGMSHLSQFGAESFTNEVLLTNLFDN